MGGLAPGAAMSGSNWLAKRSLSLFGHRTSVALEAAFWDVLEAIAARDGVTLSMLIARIDQERDPRRPLASALRLHALQHRDLEAEPLIGVKR